MGRYCKIISMFLIITLSVTMFPLRSFAGSNPNDWAVEAVDAFQKDNLAEPAFLSDYQRNVTRQEFAMLLVKAYERMEGPIQLPVNYTYKFKDGCDALYRDYIQKAYQIGVIKGYKEDVFGSYDPITREQMAVMLVRFLKLVYPQDDYSASESLNFSDKNEISDWARAAVAYVYKEGIMKGTSYDKISPKAYTTREQAIVLMYRLLIKKGILKAADNVQKTIKYIPDISITVNQGESYSLPLTLEATMSDGTVQSVSVSWNPSKVDTSKPGSSLYYGDVAGYDRKVILTLTVKASSSQLSVKDIAKKSNGVVTIMTFSVDEKPLAQGSGFIVSQDGKIVTNYHVIKDACSAKAVLGDGRQYEVEGIISYSENQDIAVLKLKNARDLPVLALGDSDKVEVGDDVVVIGRPEGLDNTVSKGNISAIRETTRKGFKDFQTTAPVAHGSSGSPLFDMQGLVIGVIYSGYDTGNLAFAIPINEIKPMLGGNSIKTLAEVNNLTQMTYEEYAAYLEKNYPGYILNGQFVPFNDYYVTEDSGTIYILISIIGDDNYLKYLESLLSKPNISLEEYRANEKYVENYIQKIYNDAQKRYPGKEIVGGLYAYFSYSFYPSNPESYYKIKYNPDTNMWDIEEWILMFGNINGFYVKWRPYAN
ncbi:trypsin-like peptidase domain-containing protein [Caldanaerobius polysaccharolyticus]|uniref:trypsin-like peptidase domain-containing protein n=1 Tax=Caldanaerobius polysaccharolyticus TaxID=44256 RepID=UPI00047E0C30|nr:trypsin-like peptidase domain-containing protein [Caldanaerobius polysaccharolyticus]